MEILMDTREKNPLTFQMITGVSVRSQYLEVGDYAAMHSDGTLDNTVIERKSVADLFHSFTHEYENEKAKIMRAKELGLNYVLAVESPVSEVVKGCSYKKGGKTVEIKKSGIAQVRQIMTVARKYGIEVWWCQNRKEMAFMIQEYFLAMKRMKEKEASDGRRKDRSGKSEFEGMEAVVVKGLEEGRDRGTSEKRQAKEEK